VGPLSLVMDLRIDHDRVGSSTDPTLNVLDKSLNDTVADKIRKYCSDYNNTPMSVVSFMSFIDSMSGRLHREFIRL
jgi:hypothetical protein